VVIRRWCRRVDDVFAGLGRLRYLGEKYTYVGELVFVFLNVIQMLAYLCAKQRILI
jgi:hypothetical protein